MKLFLTTTSAGNTRYKKDKFNHFIQKEFQNFKKEDFEIGNIKINKINKIKSGVLKIKGFQFQLDATVHLYLTTNGMFNSQIEIDNVTPTIYKKINQRCEKENIELFKDISITCNNNQTISFDQLIWEYYLKLIWFEKEKEETYQNEIRKIQEEILINETPHEGQMKMKKWMDKNTFFDPYMVASGPMLGGYVFSPPLLIIFDSKNEFQPNKNWELISNNYVKPIFIYNYPTPISNLYCSENLNDVIEFQLYKDFTVAKISSQFSALYDWLIEIQKKSKKIINNMKETNPVFWSSLQDTIELWQLNLQDVFTDSSFLYNHQQTKILNEQFLNKQNKKFNETKKTMEILKNNVLTGIINLSTPGKIKADEYMQKETEKVNERILFLSFIAMAVPLIATISSPDISYTLKIYAALTIILLPLSYITIRKIQYTLRWRASKKGRLHQMHEEIKQQISSNKETLKEIESYAKKSNSSDTELMQYIQNYHLKEIEYAKKLKTKIKKQIK